MTLRHRVIAVALAALAIIAVLGAQLVLRYADTQRSLSEVVDTLAPASTAVADLNEDINNMERRLRIYVSSDSTGMGLLYEAAVVSAQANLEELRTLLEGREPDITLVGDVESDLAAWLATVGDPVTSAMDDGERKVAQEILDSPQSQSAYVQLTSDTFRLSSLLTRQQKEALDDLAAAATRLAWTLGAALVVLLLLPLATYVAVRRHVLKPIAALREQLREAATPGHHDAVIVPVGPPELRDLGADAEALRRALVHEIDEATAAREALEQEGPVVEAIRRELAARTEAVPLGVTIAGSAASGRGRAGRGLLGPDPADRRTGRSGDLRRLRARPARGDRGHAAQDVDHPGPGRRPGPAADPAPGVRCVRRRARAVRDGCHPDRRRRHGRGPVGQRRTPRTPDHPGRRHDRAARARPAR